MEIELVSEGESGGEEEKKGGNLISDIHQVDMSMNESNAIELEQIQLVEEDKETKENHIEMVKSLFLEHILQNVFERIGEKSKIESKRKTWNKIRKVEKVQEAE